MDIYATSSSTPDYFRIDDLLDFSNDDLFSSSASTCTSSSTAPPDHPLSPPQNPSTHHPSSAPYFNPNLSTNFTDHLSVPTDDVAELEWLSRFVDDSFIDFPTNSLTGTINVRSDTSFSGKAARSKRSRATTATMATNNNDAAANAAWSTETAIVKSSKSKKESSNNRASSSPMREGGIIRRCTHCASEKTPQWRTGPLGPKTLCNACGVRYKSGRLVPEYRPAASPTFVLTQHSNSHRKVLELRRQKEMMLRQQLQLEEQHMHHPRHQDFEVC